MGLVRMRSNCVAILDIRSAEMTAVVGERGVNGTFIIKSKYSCAYDGYAEGELLDVENFISSVADVVKSTLSGGSGIKSFYVGVPGEFIKLVNADKAISFHSAKKSQQATAKRLSSFVPPQAARSGKRYGAVRFTSFCRTSVKLLTLLAP